eukprot:TRINITY_DN949_c1_g1_i2.p1 TRINITY_DN949_c1_g1~~TRINITY_DN949_c1_g1_i2.p1  ORF type:complete len:651 (+),score=129.52 TRINITY_DN949_c1_g1_i2:1281-3233(+)
MGLLPTVPRRPPTHQSLHCRTLRAGAVALRGRCRSAIPHFHPPTSTYSKLVFRQYTSAAFTSRVRRSAHEQHLALLGPVLRAATADTLLVVLRAPPRSVANRSLPLAFHIDGLRRVGKHPLLTRPRQLLRLRFRVTAAAEAAARAHVPSRMLLYRATLRGRGPDGSAGIYRALLGPAVVYRRGALSAHGVPTDVQRELFAVLWVGNENRGDEQRDEQESNLMHSINGRVFCALPRFHVEHGQATRLYLGAVGNEVDVHTAHLHGLVGVNAGGEHLDSVRLLPGSTAALQIVPDNVGTWLFHCHINDHLHAGMVALLSVRPTRAKQQAPLRLSPTKYRVYYVQAEDMMWDYTPHGRNLCDDVAFGDDELIFTDDSFQIHLGGATGFAIGSKYLKSRYVQYTDATFSTRVTRDASERHLGVMGPVLRARVGDQIVIHFRNNASAPVSMHPHGVLYDKANEGAPYNDGTFGRDKKDDRVMPGEQYTYRWQVPERAGPGPGERQQSKLWMYHSHRNEISDTYAGLFGVILVVGSKGGGYDEDTLLPSDGTSEVFLHMTVMNEAGSFHFEHNILSNEGNRNLTREQLDALMGSDEFQESNLMHSINGFLYCNAPVITLSQGQPTRFYFYALGTEGKLRGRPSNSQHEMRHKLFFC